MATKDRTIAIMVGVMIAIIGIAVVSSLVGASTPPPVTTGAYVCPYGDGLSFDTLYELQVHVMNAHPGERIPVDITWT